jgi:hypothetical protein
MNQDEMLVALAQLMAQAEEQEGPPGITTKEMARAQGRLVISHPFRDRLNDLIERGLVSVQRGKRKNTMGELTRPPVYVLTEEARRILEQFSE